MIVIVDYKVGNFFSVKNMLKKAGEQNVIISSSTDDILSADKLILPGVGAFDYGMSQLNESGLIAALNQKVLVEKTPVLGICLGSQMLTESSEEGKSISGLGWSKGKTVRINKEKLGNKDLRIPHMGWNEVLVKKANPLFNNLNEARFYFVHSFHIQCEDDVDTLATSIHGYEFTTAVNRENIYGVQFHPEKSHRFGLQLLKNFSQI
jgi:imidazole glycerol-phosphate synthase subunit HisH